MNKQTEDPGLDLSALIRSTAVDAIAAATMDVQEFNEEDFLPAVKRVSQIIVQDMERVLAIAIERILEQASESTANSNYSLKKILEQDDRESRFKYLKATHLHGSEVCGLSIAANEVRSLRELITLAGKV